MPLKTPGSTPLSDGSPSCIPRLLSNSGLEKAPVRLGGLYALERLAQGNEGQRQIIINVLCAYLRMPYELPGSPPAADARQEEHVEHRERIQEREVRIAAQRILTDHLQSAYVNTFWDEIDLDLTAARLIDFSLRGARVRSVNLRSVLFTGTVDFVSAAITSNATFASANFAGNANFRLATFDGYTDFGSVTFSRHTDFESATFSGYTDFRSATFGGPTDFRSATFNGHANYEEVIFPSEKSVNFTGVTFEYGVPPRVERFLRPDGPNR